MLWTPYFLRSTFNAVDGFLRKYIRSEIAALLSAVGGFSYLIMWIRVTDLCTSQLQHYLVRWAALVT